MLLELTTCFIINKIFIQVIIHYIFIGAVALRINPTIYCVNFKFAKQYIVCKFLYATAPN
ncbi:hypothetical protein IYC_11754 [Clostridium sporogenes PA 3679]|nr:hypothetical protein CLSPOx_01580 [Clostridium sporogenes]AVP60711.1 hypothetical protein C7M79_08330 [Clostridium botulinum]EHN14939.1 hypothetical protein IYC_11754 [Clostridium sporogenes PA 3679]OOO67456.1 hypothetical protein BS099_08260 [Clostridium sporogenes]